MEQSVRFQIQSQLCTLQAKVREPSKHLVSADKLDLQAFPAMKERSSNMPPKLFAPCAGERLILVQFSGLHISWTRDSSRKTHKSASFRMLSTTLWMYRLSHKDEDVARARHLKRLLPLTQKRSAFGLRGEIQSSPCPVINNPRCREKR